MPVNSPFQDMVCGPGAGLALKFYRRSHFAGRDGQKDNSGQILHDQDADGDPTVERHHFAAFFQDLHGEDRAES